MNGLVRKIMRRHGWRNKPAVKGPTDTRKAPRPSKYSDGTGRSVFVYSVTEDGTEVITQKPRDRSKYQPRRNTPKVAR